MALTPDANVNTPRSEPNPSPAPDAPNPRRDDPHGQLFSEEKGNLFDPDADVPPPETAPRDQVPGITEPGTENPPPHSAPNQGENYPDTSLPNKESTIPLPEEREANTTETALSEDPVERVQSI